MNAVLHNYNIMRFFSIIFFFFLNRHMHTHIIEEQQETSNKHQKNCENNKTGIKTEILDIKEENKLMTTEDVSEKLGTKSRYRF